ncbi:hypothetical protein [Bacillus alkalicellulosilyticus]|uniref:hypothetical protein n=1 Tax=Alkalihalobacterium alkalicellulosilyticum TaxID=1912214 RepID=UPI001482484E|nr:hypothetical protein [Bacillus alkalicellulosilyticus]
MNKIIIIISIFVLLLTVYLRVADLASPTISAFVGILMIANIAYCIRRIRNGKRKEV